jgi:hypothetical protein
VWYQRKSYLEEAPGFQLSDVPQFSSLGEEFARVFAGEGDVSRDLAEQLDDVSQVVLVSRVVVAGVRLEQEVPGGQLERLESKLEIKTNASNL